MRNQYGVIFGALKEARKYAKRYNSARLFEAVEHAEKVAAAEILDVDLSKYSCPYDAVLASIFHGIRDEVN